MDMPWLTTIVLLPTVGALVAWGSLAGSSPDDGDGESRASFARWTALAAALLAVAVSLLVAVRFDVTRAGTFQFTEVHSWIPQFGVSYAVGVDGIALTMLVLSTVLVPASVLAGWREVAGRRAVHFFALMLVLETSMIGVFIARDVFLFYVF